MFRSGLLLLGWPSTGRQLPLAGLWDAISKQVQNTLYIHMIPDSLLSGKVTGPLSAGIPCTTELHHFLMNLYGRGAACCGALDIRILLSNFGTMPDVASSKPLHLCHGYEVLFLPEETSSQSVLQKYVREHFPADGPIPCQILPSLAQSQTDTSPTDTQSVHPKFNHVKAYDHVVIGGTFDRLHTGHKLLLTESCLRSNKSLTIGVTDGAMNAKKTLCELIEPVDVRMAKLRNFLEDVKPELEYKIVPILDPFGPSTVDPDLLCIVVSQETSRGGEAVNKIRKEKGLSVLDMYEIALVEDEHRSKEEETKISSSSLRKRLLGTLLKDPLCSTLSEDGVYVLGLTGGIASGKSSVCRRLEKLGAAVVDCDKLGHKAYLKGSPTFDKVVDVFGEDVVGDDGEINRRALGGKVFGNKVELDKLNAVVWPAIAELAKHQIQEFAKAGHQVVVLDAAVLLEAGWQSLVNEVWVAVVPRNEAVKRIVDRNGLSEEEASKRIDSQLSNTLRVQQANVVLSTLWEPDVTQIQVEKAWSLLQQRFPSKL